MILNLPFLDLVWRALILAGFVSTGFSLSMLLSGWAFGSVHPGQARNRMNVQLLLLMTVFCGGLMLLAFGAPQIIARCFDGLVLGGFSSTVTRWVSLLWLISAGTLLSRDLVQIIIAHKTILSLAPLDCLTTLNRITKIKKDLGIIRPVVVQTTSAKVSPCTYGILVPRLIVPAWLFEQEADLSVQQATLAHELVHVRERDCFWISLNLLCRRLFFWNPLVAFACERHQLQIELNADFEAAKSKDTSHNALIQALIRVSEVCHSAARNRLCSEMTGPFYHTRSRITALGNPNNKIRKAHASRILLCWAIGLGSCVSQAQDLFKAYGTKPQLTRVRCTQASHERFIQSLMLSMPDPPRSE